MKRLPVRLGLLLMLAVAMPRPAVAADPEPFDLDAFEVAPGIVAYVEHPTVGIVSGTVITVTGSQGVLVFDTGHHPSITKRIVKDLRNRTRLPVRFIVNSHWHDDHWAGNGVFTEQWPGASVIAHRFTAAMIEQRKDKFRGVPCINALNDQAKPTRDELATGRKPDGSPLSPLRRGLDEKLVAEVAFQVRECERMVYRPPDLTFEDALEVHLGGRDVWLLHLGRGNTAGDVVALIPDARVLLTGDVLVHPFPFATEAYIGEWAQVLRRLEALDTVAIVPGHGAVQLDKTYLGLVAELMESITTQAHAVYKPGMTLAEFTPLVKLDAFRTRFTGDDPFLQANFDAMIGQLALERAWQEMSGALHPEGE